MRPVNKGEYTDCNPYQDARNPLIDRIGDYCSYCELAKELAVEHVVPHTKGGEKYKWENFLLGCQHCNGSSNKSNKNSSREGYYWADIHNTAFVFQYLPNNTIRPNSKLTTAQ